MINIKESGILREIFDDLNPRIYKREWKCAECGDWVDEDDTVWIDPITGKATMEGNPYHTECGPPEGGDE